eukprot:4156269-Prymnesium_polylepis.2
MQSQGGAAGPGPCPDPGTGPAEGPVCAHAEPLYSSKPVPPGPALGPVLDEGVSPEMRVNAYGGSPPPVDQPGVQGRSNSNVFKGGSEGGAGGEGGDGGDGGERGGATPQETPTCATAASPFHKLPRTYSKLNDVESSSAAPDAHSFP